MNRSQHAIAERLGRWTQYAMDTLNITQGVLASSLGVSQPVISDTVHRKGLRGCVYISRLSGVLGVTMYEIVTTDPPVRIAA